jgi:hypothetical protein
MIIAAVGILLFWAAWAAWTGWSMTLNAATLRRRIGGAALMLTGVVGLIYGVRLLAS